MHESDFRNRLDGALWHLTKGIGIEVVFLDSVGRLQIDQTAARDVHMIRSSWPEPNAGQSPREDVYCARTLLAKCESRELRELPPGRLARSIRDALELP